MRLTAHTDYALRLLMLLAVEPEQLHTIEEVAQRYDISRNHLMKVTQTLVHSGL
jgi:Rrf2 family nitric oxide-sensitive transcriptional repressor